MRGRESTTPSDRLAGFKLPASHPATNRKEAGASTPRHLLSRPLADVMRRTICGQPERTRSPDIAVDSTAACLRRDQ